MNANGNSAVSVVCLLSIVGVSLPSAAAPDEAQATVKQEIQKGFDRWEPVAKTLNGKKIRAFLRDGWAPSYVEEWPNQPKMNRVQALQATVGFMSTVRALDHWKIRVQKVERLHSKKAIVFVTSDYAYAGVDSKGKRHQYKGKREERDTFVSTGGRWKMTRNVNLKDTATEDSKPMPSTPSPAK